MAPVLSNNTTALKVWFRSQFFRCVIRKKKQRQPLRHNKESTRLWPGGLEFGTGRDESCRGDMRLGGGRWADDAGRSGHGEGGRFFSLPENSGKALNGLK